MKVRLSAEAERDLEEIGDWIARDNPARALRFVGELTTTDIGPAEFRAPIEPGPNNGLRRRSWAMADKITTVSRRRLGKRLGRLSPADMGRLNRAMLVFLGLAGGVRG